MAMAMAMVVFRQAGQVSGCVCACVCVSFSPSLSPFPCLWRSCTGVGHRCEAGRNEIEGGLARQQSWAARSRAFLKFLGCWKSDGAPPFAFFPPRQRDGFQKGQAQGAAPPIEISTPTSEFPCLLGSFHPSLPRPSKNRAQ
ncbi:hypothetical protein L1887_58695 [Cichorium endivia]|nr:hypothetical protein L1887_58695 [Cichorium endivia]